MPLDTSIPLQTKTPDINPLATMLQVGQYKYLQQNSNRLQMDTDANQAVGQAIQRNTGKDGSVNLLAVQRDLAGDPAAAYNLQGATGTNLTQQGQQISNGTAQIGQQTAQLALTSDQQAHMAQQLGTLLSKKDLSYSDIVHTAASAGEMYGLPPSVIQRSVAAIPNDPAQWKPYIQSRLASLQAPGAQLGAMTPNPTATTDGMTTTYRDANPITNPGIVGTSFDQKLPVDQRESVGTDGNGNPIVTSKDPRGTVTAVKGAPVQGQPAVQPRVIPATETPQSYAALQSVRDQTNAAAGQAPQQHFNNRAIIDILDKDHHINPTGSNSAWVAKVSGTIGLPVSGKFAEDANQISHYLAMQKQANEKAMGVSTDAGRGTSEAASGSIAMDPVSLRKAVAINDATTRGVSAYNDGMESAVAKGGIPAIRQFQNAWSKYYDVNAMRLVNADKNGDKTEADDVIKSLGGVKSAKFQQMRNNAQMLDQLKRGIIPNGGQ